MRRRIHGCQRERSTHTHHSTRAERMVTHGMSYEEEDTWMSYEEEDTCMSYEEEYTQAQE